MPLQDYLVPDDDRASIAQLSNNPLGLNFSQLDAATLPAAQQQALQALATLQQRLRDDAHAFFANHSVAARPAQANLPQPVALDAPNRLATQLADVPGIACGHRAPYQVGLQRLIDALPAHKQQGVTTLYIAGLMLDLHQADLDRYSAAPDAEMPAGLRAVLDIHDQAHGLLASARRQGLRLLALDSVASQVALSPLTEQQRQEISNYSAFLRISEDRQQPNRGRWLAWLPETQLSLFEDVPGVAELTGGIGLRLQLAEEPVSKRPQQLTLSLRRDLGEQGVRPNGERYWVKSDLLLSAQPWVNQAAIASRLQQTGQYAILAQPDRGEYQLYHRSSDQSLVRTTIQRDAATPSLLFIDRPGAKKKWEPMMRRRYTDLSALRADLKRVVGLSSAWPGLTPVLISAEPAQAPRAGRLALAPPPPPKPASSQVSDGYALTSDQLDRLTRMRDRDHRAFDEGFHPADRTPDGQARKQFYRTREKLWADAQKFFSRVATRPTRPPLPAFAPDLPIGEVLNLLIERYPGVVIGENHSDPWSKRILIEQLASLYQNGVRTLYLEHVFADQHQALLDAWQAAPGGEMPPMLLEHLRYLDSGHMAQRGYGFEAVVRAAHKQGIAIVAIDCFSSYQLKGFDAAHNKRIPMMNYYATLRMQERQGQALGAKWIAFVGELHANQLDAYPGLAELMGAVGVRIAGAPQSVTPDIGGWESDLQGAKFIKNDFIATDRPVYPDSEINARLQAPGDYAVVYAPRRNQPAYELRYVIEGKKAAVLILPNQDGSYYFPDPPWRALRDQSFSDAKSAALAAAGHASLGRNVWPKYTPQSQASLPTPQREHVLGPEETARQQAVLFERQRQAALLRMVFFASETQRADFKAGKANWQAVLPAVLSELKTISNPTLDQLKRIFAKRATSLTAKQQGVLLGAIGARQADMTGALIQDWHTQIAQRGAEDFRAIAHNRYLEAAGHQHGLCAGLVTHFASAWQQNVADAGQSTPFDHYLDNLTAATNRTDGNGARLLDLSLVAWSFAAPELKFTASPALTGRSVTEAVDDLLSATSPAAFELSLGSHAMLLAKRGAPGAETFLLADPNFGRCHLPHRQALLDVLTWHGALTQRVFSPDEPASGEVKFTLRCFRDDLASQKLFAAQAVQAGRLQALTLSQVSRPDLLAAEPSSPPLAHDAAYTRLQHELTLLEYRQALRLPGPLDPVSSLLSQILDRHQTPASAAQGRARVLKIDFEGKDAFLTLEADNGWSYKRIKIRGGTTSPDDVALLRQLDQLMQALSEENAVSRFMKNLFVRSPGIEVDRQVLAAALPEPARLARLFNHSLPTAGFTGLHSINNG